MMTSNLFLLLFYFIQHCSSEGEMRVLRSLLVKRRYNRHAIPRDDAPTKVEVGIYINSLYSIKESTMDYALNIYLRQQWTDPRLRFNATEMKIRTSNDHTKGVKIKLPTNAWDVLWTPDVFFRNEKRSSFHYVTTPNRLMTLTEDGQVFYVIKLTLTLACQMCLKKFPLDRQTCPILLESFGYTTASVYFAFLPSAPVQIDDSVEFPQFQLVDKLLTDCSQSYLTGNYTCLEISFVLDRMTGYYLTQMYIPSILVVVLSWLNFLLSPEATPARVSVGLLTVLTITTQRSLSTGDLPRVSYIKAFDIWMATCLLFVFASFLEFACVNYVSNKKAPMELVLNNRGSKNSPDEESPKLSLGIANNNYQDDTATRTVSEMLLARQLSLKRNPSSILSDLQLSRDEEDRRKKYLDNWRAEHRHRALMIDQVSCWLFPLMFATFNIFYWTYYLYLTEAMQQC